MHLFEVHVDMTGKNDERGRIYITLLSLLALWSAR